MMMIFFFKMCKILSRLLKCKKKIEKTLSGCFAIMAFQHFAKISLKKWREYVSSAVNVLPNSPKTSDLTNRDVFQLNVSKINGNFS